MDIVTELIKENMKEKKLIRPSGTEVKLKGACYVHDVITSRVEQILNQVNIQLILATAIPSFSTTKKFLEDGLEKLKRRRHGETDDVMDYVFVERNC
ncbi:unnamed protein product [Lymnaea stagnalis]|uniref:Uncharacterized protein n=1 Tax=Lymnaea stagnalis TaxID=6523 RepID=A0AAV2I504_LYMST